MNNLNKLLIIRLSSLGDIVQALEVPSAVKRRFPQAKVHWLVRSDFSDLPHALPEIDKVWSYERKTGLAGLWKMIQLLKSEKYDGVYDAHSNLRSHIICLFLRTPHFIRRSKERFKRFLLFSFGINHLPKPYKGTLSFLEPLKPWGISTQVSPSHSLKLPAPKIEFTNSILIAPSAAWELKRWPLEYWQELVAQLKPHPVFILGGPQDNFCEDIAQIDPERIKNLAGQLSWSQTTAAIAQAELIISGDTGVLHIADFLGRKTIALIGPTAFGYPSRPTSKVLEVPLDCRPCTKDGRGKCKNKVFKKCLMDISSQQVNQASQEMLKG